MQCGEGNNSALHTQIYSSSFSLEKTIAEYNVIKVVSKCDLETNEYYIENGFVDAGVEIPCACNFHCKHCYRDGIIPDLTFEDVLNVFRKLKKMGVVNVYITGGEVFAYKYFEKLYLYIKKEGFLLNILTNGSKIFQYKNILKEYPPSQINITLYGTNEKEYRDFVGKPNQFDAVLKSLEFLSMENIPFSLCVVITRENYNSVMDGKFDRIAKKFNKTISYNYLLIPTITGDSSPLRLQLSGKEILDYLNKYGKKVKPQKKQADFFCRSGKYSVTVNNCDTFSVCLKDRRKLFSAKLETSVLVSLIKNRTVEIKKEAEKMECLSCSINACCEWCPVQFEYNDNQQNFICQLNHFLSKEFLCDGRNN